jgi:flagellar biogenesis protein FliO
MGYLGNFIVYTLAMIGVMMIALFVFKKSMHVSGGKGGAKHLRVIDAMSLAPRKTLYVVSTGNEKFLIAGDAERTTLISKLQDGLDTKNIELEDCTASSSISSITSSKPSFPTSLADIEGEKMRTKLNKQSYIDRAGLGIHKTANTPYASVMKNLAEKMRMEGLNIRE